MIILRLQPSLSLMPNRKGWAFIFGFGGYYCVVSSIFSISVLQILLNSQKNNERVQT